jgi:hypothetical protein
MWQYRHASICHQIPTSVKAELANLKDDGGTAARNFVELWAESARKKGMVNTASGIKLLNQSH